MSFDPKTLIPAGDDASMVSSTAENLRRLSDDVDGLIGRTFREQGADAAQVLADRAADLLYAADILDRLYGVLDQ